MTHYPTAQSLLKALLDRAEWYVSAIELPHDMNGEELRRDASAILGLTQGKTTTEQAPGGGRNPGDDQPNQIESLIELLPDAEEACDQVQRFIRAVREGVLSPREVRSGDDPQRSPAPDQERP